MSARIDMIEQLQSDILRLQGFKPASAGHVDLGLGPIANNFPNKTFPTGAVHEFLASSLEDVAATDAFIAGLMSSLICNHGAILWICNHQRTFPPALKMFGLQPDRIIFVIIKNEKDILWAMDEALKCSALTAVIAELKDVGFTDSRRLQLAVEQSKVTGFIVRTGKKQAGTTTCVSRWRITSQASQVIDNLPGIGFPLWKVELLRMRNGKTGIWNLQWTNGRFSHIHNTASSELEQLSNTG